MTAALAFFLSHRNTGSASRPVLPSRWSYLLNFPQLPCYAESIVFVPVGSRGCLYCFWGGHVCVCGFFSLGGWKVWQSSEDGVVGPSVWYGSSPLYPPSFEEESAPLYFSIMLCPFSFTCLGQVKGWRRENP